MKTLTHRSGIISLFLGATLAQPVMASVIHPEVPVTPDPVDFGTDDGSHPSDFGKQTRETAKLVGPAKRDAVSKSDPMDMPILAENGADKWENHQSHLDDDKWDTHKNGVPGPIGNPCMSAYCEPSPSAVPVPAAAWLLGSGLVGLVGVARRRTH